jgi:hypothetical protein
MKKNAGEKSRETVPLTYVAVICRCRMGQQGAPRHGPREELSEEVARLLVHNRPTGNMLHTYSHVHRRAVWAEMGQSTI